MIPEQSKIESFIEATTNTVSGFVIALAVYAGIVTPLYDLDVTFFENIEITCIMALVSVARSYLWRRCFNSRFSHRVRKWVGQ